MTTYKPMLAQPAKESFDDPGWIFEPKWDGIRVIARIDEKICIHSRNGLEISLRFPEFSELSRLTSHTVLDGEVIVIRGGRPDFNAVIKRLNGKGNMLGAGEPATLVVFDILERGGEVLTGRPLSERKAILSESVEDGVHVVKSTYTVGQGIALYQAAVSMGLEGVMAKRSASVYRPGERSSDWLKIKRLKSADFVVVGYSAGEGSRSSSFGALLLGLYGGDKLTYVGRVGTGFSDAMLADIVEQLSSLKTDVRQIEAEDIPEKVIWVLPEYTAEVSYDSFTADGRLRAPRFIRLKTDKDPRQCTFDQLKPPPLSEYRAKRDFSKSPEPSAQVAAQGGNSYVVQEHHARQLHYDLRLEKDGVLKSWAVPKGIPEKAGEKRLAVAVEDHPIEYRNFQGTIPKGEYGAGTVSIWEEGTYILIHWSEDKIAFMATGRRMRGVYELIKFKKAGEKEWLLFRKSLE